MTQQPIVLQNALTARPWDKQITARLPGLHPVNDGEWLIRDEAYADQMRLRDGLFTERRESVFAETAESQRVQRELFALILRDVRASGDFQDEGRHLVRPDGIAVDVSQPPPLIAAARLVQEDLAILAPGDGGHKLVAGAIAFPASWMLAEKMGRSLTSIHDPVKRIAPEMDGRIETLLSRLPPDRIVQRSNALAYNDPSLHQPRPETAPRSYDPAATTFIRVERQTLRRLPQSNAVAFTIHTSIVPFARLSDEDQTGACAYLESIGAPRPTPAR